MNKAKQGLRAAALATAIGLGGCATDGNTDYTRVLNDVLSGYGQTLGQEEVTAGLKEALTIGTSRAVSGLAIQDGYFSDNLIHINLPGDLRDVQENLSKIGLSGPLDQLELRINRAAEAAAPTAKNLVVEAVSSMTIEDALGILNGGDTAATKFLQARTTDQLSGLLRPYMQSALDETGAGALFNSLSQQYLPASMANQLREDFVTHAVDGALDGVFYYLAEEEKAIREDPVKRTTELLRRVFGSQG